MSNMYHPSTPVASRVREGHFGEAILPPVGVQPGPVYVYDAAIRIWHWVTALCIVALAITGYFIGSPPPEPGRRGDHRPLPVRLHPLRAFRRGA